MVYYSKQNRILQENEMAIKSSCFGLKHLVETPKDICIDR